MKHNGTTLIIVSFLLASLILAGCAAPQSNAAGGSNMDPCALLTKADAEKIMGKTVGSPTHPITASQAFDVTSCAYQADGGTAMDKASIIVTVPNPRDVNAAKSGFDIGKKSAAANWNATPVDVAGVGDTAYWVGGAGNNIQILKGDVYITLSAATQKGDAPSAAIIDLAKLIVSRLP